MKRKVSKLLSFVSLFLQLADVFYLNDTRIKKIRGAKNSRVLTFFTLFILLFSLPLYTACFDTIIKKGKYSAAVNKSFINPGDSRCLYGGIAVSTGIDTNGNGILDADEVKNTEYVCNGVPGEDGANGTNGADGQDGTNGTNGADGQNGTNGTDGLNALVVLGDAGTECPAGGKKIQSGLDRNGNGSLDADEIINTENVCNGAPGTDGNHGSDGTDGVDSLVNSTDEPAGDNCVAGGIKIESGPDSNYNGMLDEEEVISTKFVCNGNGGINGINGVNGHNALVNVTDEPEGANCADGGLKIDTGVDLNDNNAIDPGEIANTSYICDGGNGAPAATSNVRGIITQGNYLALPHNLGRDDLTFTGQFVKDGNIYDYDNYRWLFPVKYLNLYASGTFGSSSLQYAQIAALTSGNYVIIYQDNSDGLGRYIIVNNAGALVKAPAVFNPSVGSADSAVVALNNGNFVIAYRDHNNGERGCLVIYDSAGNIVTGPVVFYAGESYNISMACLQNGNFVIAFRDLSNARCMYMIYGPTGTNVRGATVFLGQHAYTILVSPLDSGHFVIGYCLVNNQSFIVFTADGTVFSSGQVNNSNSSYLTISQISNGNFVFAYTDDKENNYGKFSIYNTGGTRITGPVTFDSNSGNGADIASAAYLGNGNFALVYKYSVSYRSYDKVAIFDTAGTKITDKIFSQYFLDSRLRNIVKGADGRIAIVARSGNGYFYSFDFRDGDIRLQKVSNNEVRLHNLTNETLEFIMSVHQ